MQVLPQTLEGLRAQIPEIMLGSIFVFVGAVALAISAVRHRKTMRAVVWFGLLSFCYGLRLLMEARTFVGLLPPWVMAGRAILIVVLTHAILVPALLVWYDLSTGIIRKLVRVFVGLAIVLAVLGAGNALTGNNNRFLPLNNVLAIVFTILIASLTLVPSLAKRYLVIQSRVMAAGTLVLAAMVLQVNLARFLPIGSWAEWEPIAFGIFVLSVGFVAIERVLQTEGKLQSIEQELDVAREIQNSILPESTPKLDGLSVAATYHPATSVAGDFYDFVEVDPKHIGFLIADVSGHGVPAALIASMIKVAMHAVKSSAANPSELIKGLNRILTQQLKGQFVTAAYLYLDLETKIARYAAAGHPPMVRCNRAGGEIERVESNGLLFGVLKETEYPAVELSIKSGDRFLLYSDGISETENAAGEQFQAQRMNLVLQQNHPVGAEQLSETLFRESAGWQPANLPQQDDVTMVLVDVQ
jgi:sigma-B regulation protein RsbU (phosphoserine phosphatase)